MTDAEFRALLATQRRPLRPQTAEACRLVLVVGETGYAAARTTGIQQSTVSRAVARLTAPPPPRCPCCGQQISARRAK